MSYRILIVDDEKDIRELLTFQLLQHGFIVDAASNGEEALDKIEEKPPDLIILDLMMPKMDGAEVCRVLKREEKTRRIPIIMLTAKGEEIDRVVGFELGADDYVPKPFSPRELALRVKAILKRVTTSDEPAEFLAFKDLNVDLSRHRVTVAGKPVELTSTEFKLLTTLLQRRGRVQTRDHLLETVWGYDYIGFTRTVDTHIRRLRAKLGSAGDCIETVRGVGYRFVDEDVKDE
jgi:two-component system phosphate regulon response regulator PhoB